jgi:hypothetical protein
VTHRNALVIGLLLTLGIGAFTLAVMVGGSEGGDITVDSNPAIIELLPHRGDQVMPQTNVGLILAPGWSGELIRIGGKVIPLDQQRVQNALNSVIFRPVEGLVMDRLPAQEVCAQARYWPVQNPGRTATIDWCFRVDG